MTDASVEAKDKIINDLPQDKTDVESTTPEVVETQEEINWKLFREGRKQDRAQREAAEKKAQEKEAEVAALKAAMEAAFAKGQPAQQQQYDYEQEESEDARIEKKVLAALAQREAAAAKERQRREAEEFPTRLQQQFPDFNQVISVDNLEYLEFHQPAIANALKRLPDGYDKWRDTYEIVKKMIPNTDTKRDSARADANFNKPKSISSPGLSQTAEGLSANRLSEDRKAANWERMQKSLRGLT